MAEYFVTDLSETFLINRVMILQSIYKGVNGLNVVSSLNII